MGNYDGPSFYKENHPRIKPIKNDQPSKRKNIKYTLPKNVRTQDDLKDEARELMNTPSQPVPNDPPPERYPFKSKYIPDSLQHLGGWKQPPQIDQELLNEIAARLDKEEHTCLLFADRLSDEMTQKLETMESEERHREKAAEEREQQESAVQEKVVQVKEVQKEVMKPSTGLHRSLSNIIAEEQKGIDNSKLNSLFTNDEKR